MPIERDAGRAAPVGARSLVDSVVEATDATRLESPGVAEARPRLDAFHREPSPVARPGALDRPGGRAAGQAAHRRAAGAGHRPARRVDLPPGQRHPPPSAVSELEASWRGLHYLVNQIEDADVVKVRVLSVSWKELTRDMERAIEFDQSQLFRKVYSDEYGTAGGEPFGVLLGDYEIRSRPCAEHPTDDVEALRDDLRRRRGGVRPVHHRRASLALGTERLQLPGTRREPVGHVRPTGVPEVAGVSRAGGLSIRRADLASRADAASLRRRRIAASTDSSFARRWPGRIARSTSGETRPMPSAPCWPARSPSRAGWPTSAASGATSRAAAWSRACPSTAFGTDKRGVAPKCSTDVIGFRPPGAGIERTGVPAALRLRRDGVLGLLRGAIGAEAEEVRRSGGHDQRPGVEHVALHAVRVAVRPLSQGGGPRQDRRVQRGERGRGLLAPLAPAVRDFGRRGRFGDQGGVAACGRPTPASSNIPASREATSASPGSGRTTNWTTWFRR